MQGLLEGKVAVITGAGSGVGRAAIKLWAEHGAKVIAADINLPNAEESVKLAGAPQGQIKAVECNVADPDSVSAAVALAVETFGRLDIIYNNAGITVLPIPGVGMKKLVDLDHAEMRKVEEVNINGVIFGCQAAIRQFDKQAENGQGGAGVIVNTASVAGLTGYGGVLYGSTKGAVVAMTRTLAIEVAEKGIRVNSVCPAGMLTNYGGMNPEHEQKDKILEGMGKAHPLGKAIDPADTAGAAMFLASDLAGNITGVNLPVDGGLTAGKKVGG
ncbi:SDR family oxidoreductase [Novosphingobium sp. PS1R-30]|uniref:SDR family oxidoreductase n=1 Tax=Novosphingobium anseongense TaxID=3133436 RepID=A0ABU8RX29_9SPHN